MSDVFKARSSIYAPSISGQYMSTNYLACSSDISGVNGVISIGSYTDIQSSGLAYYIHSNGDALFASIQSSYYYGIVTFDSDVTLAASGNVAPLQLASSSDSLMNRTLTEQHRLFGMLNTPASDAGIYVANGGTAAAGDGDGLASGTTANARPLVYRYRSFQKNPGHSGGTDPGPVRSLKMASIGYVSHPGSTNSSGKFRIGLGISIASAPAGNANPLSARGFGGEIFWDGTNRMFRLFAHDGTTFVTNDGLSGRPSPISTGLTADVNQMFYIQIGLDTSTGTVSAWTAFGDLDAIRSVDRTTPTITLGGGPTSGSFGASGYPSWGLANHSTNVATTQMVARIIDRQLFFV